MKGQALCDKNNPKSWRLWERKLASHAYCTTHLVWSVVGSRVFYSHSESPAGRISISSQASQLPQKGRETHAWTTHSFCSDRTCVTSAHISLTKASHLDAPDILGSSTLSGPFLSICPSLSEGSSHQEPTLIQSCIPRAQPRV